MIVFTALEKIMFSSLNAHRFELLYKTSQQIGRHLDPEHLYLAVHQAVLTLLNCETFFIALVDQPRNEFENVYMFDRGQRVESRRFPIATGVAGYAMAHDESLKIDDTAHLDPARFGNLIHFGDTRHSTRSILLALMRRGGVVIGALSVQSYTSHTYTDEDLDALELLAANAAIAIENAQYYAEAIRESERRTVLYEASQKMGELDLDHLYTAIYQSVERLMPCEEFVITMVEGEQIEHIYLINRQGQWPPQRVPLGSGMIGYALKTGESIRIDDTTNVDPSRFVPIRFGDPGVITHSVLVAMMRRGGKIIGALSAQAYPKGAYTDGDLRTLELLAAQAAIAIDNARLFAITQRHATIDDLTSIYNRRYLMQQAQVEFDRAKHGMTALALIMLDIDFFKRVNDSYGHLIGDRLLRSLCQECLKHLP
jgi:GAF domain-containing protein